MSKFKQFAILFLMFFVVPHVRAQLNLSTPGFSSISNRRIVVGSGSEFNPATDVTSQPLVLWVKADGFSQADDSLVSSWPDSNGGLAMTNTDASSTHPKYKVNIINGKPAILFDGTDDRLANAMSQDGTIIAVVKPTSIVQFRCFYGARSPTGGSYDAILLGTSATPGNAPLWRRGFGNNTAPVQAQGTSGTLVVNNVYIWTVDVTESGGNVSLRQWLNGNAAGTGIQTTATKSAIDLSVIGHGVFNGGYVDAWPGYVAEVLVFSGPLSDSDREAVEAYLNGKYAVWTPTRYAASVSIDTDSGVGDSASGDLTGDGIPELVTASPGGADAHFRAWRWSGTAFTNVTIAAVGGKQDRFGGDIKIIDINGDGWNDIVTADTANSGTSGSQLWYENPDGDLAGTWTEHVVDTWSGSGAGNIVTHSAQTVGDVNGDGHADIVARDVSHGSWVWIQASPFDGSTWNTRKFIAHNPREGEFLFDIDGDGDLDIFINGIWFETPSDPVAGTYTQRAIIGAEAWYPGGASGDQINDYASKVWVADMNGDTKPDFIITNAEELSGASASKPHGIRIFLQPADRINDTWTEIVVEPDHFAWHSLEIADVDGDGDLDIFTGRSEVGVDTNTGLYSAVYLNSASGATWTPEIIGVTGNPVYQMSIGDFDGDGDIDVVSPHTFISGAIRYYKNISP